MKVERAQIPDLFIRANADSSGAEPVVVITLEDGTELDLTALIPADCPVTVTAQKDHLVIVNVPFMAHKVTVEDGLS